uniref:Transmembrane protein 161A n=1 Tax=Anser cygnoides TaxID=8845 RepID=A0A8B9EPF7_ANSCY
MRTRSPQLGTCSPPEGLWAPWDPRDEPALCPPVLSPRFPCRRVNGVLDDKPLSVPRDINLRLDTSPITAVDALGNPPWEQQHQEHPQSTHPMHPPHYSRSSLHRYKHPSEEELRALAGKQRPKAKRVNGVLDDKPLSVPRDINLRLDTSPITAVDGYFCLADPQKETNIGVLWCLLTVVFSVKVFFMVMRHYFRSEEGGERSVCLTFAFFFLLLAMVALVIREDYLEFGLEPGLAGVSSNLENVLKQRGWEWTLPLGKLAFKLGLVALCSFLGACLTFPGLRLAQTHLDALRMAADKPLTQVLLHVSFLAPVIVVVMWIKPISRDFLLHAPMGKQTVQIMSDSAYNTARLWTIVGLCLLRLAVTRHHLQAYLCLAERWVEQMRKEAGRIAVVEIQRKITRIYCYVSVVSLQYLGPVILTLHCALLLKTLGHHSWGLYPEPSPVPPAATAAPSRPGSEDGEDVRAAVEQITGVLGGIFTPLFFRGLLAFLTWWVAVCQVVTSLFGLYFHQYLAAS